MESLLPELLLPILIGLLDLESLDNLFRASPAAFRVFEGHSAEVFEAVLSSGTTNRYTCALIRIVALVRSASLPLQAHGLETFQNFVRHETTSHRYRKPLWTLPPTKLSSDVSATTLRGLLATHRRITCLTINCLKFYLSRFKPLRPSHPVDQNFHFKFEWDGENCIFPWQQYPAENPFPVHDIGPPTWIEEERVMRAFWRVQLFRDLKNAVTAGLVNWSEKDVVMLLNQDLMTDADFYHVPTYSLLGQDELSSYEPYVYQQDELLEHELIWTVVAYTNEDRQTVIAPDLLQTRRDYPKPIAKGPQDLEAMNDHTSQTYRFFYDLSGSRLSHDSDCASPLQHISFLPFRRLGFAIWDSERMINYGLLNIRNSGDPYFLAWRSILGRDVIAAVERENQRWQEWISKENQDSDDSLGCAPPMRTDTRALTMVISR